jgi:hypothetical protein
MKLSRRSILRGIGGVSMSLPWLEVIAENKLEMKLNKPPRLAFLFSPNGVNENKWDPKMVNGQMELSPILAPLESIKSEVDVFKNLNHEGSNQPGGHMPKTANFLSGVHINHTTGKDIRSAVSIDQVFAKKYGHLTPIPSIELGIHPIRVLVYPLQQATQTSMVDTSLGIAQRHHYQKRYTHNSLLIAYLTATTWAAHI